MGMGKKICGGLLHRGVVDLVRRMGDFVVRRVDVDVCDRVVYPKKYAHVHRGEKILL
jgi:hypothetical protein